MVRGKIEIKKIENVTSRQVTFSKRRSGLFKKAHELSVLCDAQVAAIVFSQSGRLYEFSSSEMEKTIERYGKFSNEYFTPGRPQVELYLQELKKEMEIMVRKIDLLEVHQRKLMGQGLSSCSKAELQEIDTQIEKSLRIVRFRKAELYADQLGKLKEKERELLDERKRLREKEMVRGKIEIKKIENGTSRQVTFSKRRSGLFKKAHELSVLCDAEVAAIVFSQSGRLYEFSSSEMEKTIERYGKLSNGYFVPGRPQVEIYLQELKKEMAIMVKKIDLLEVHQRKLMGQGLGSCSVAELQEVDTQIEKSLRIVRSRKAELYADQLRKLKEKERELLDERRRLCEKERQLSNEKRRLHEQEIHTEKGELEGGCRTKNSTEVETDLFIGLPVTRL